MAGYNVNGTSCRSSGRGCPSVPPNETPYVLDAGGLTCSRPNQEKLVITLQGGSEIEPLKSLPFTATVINQINNQPPTNHVTVNISLKVDPNSG